MGSKTRARQAMEKAGVPFVPGTSRGVESFEEAGAGRRENRLSGDAESGRGWRRQRHAAGARSRAAQICSGSSPQRGGALFRRQRSLHREGDRQSAAHRDAGARRRARQHGLPWRARMLAATPPSEGAGRSAFAHRRCRHAAPDGRGCGPRRASRRTTPTPARSSSWSIRRRISISWR